MFQKILVANRGEIAVRVLRACRELGVETVAVYSDADRNALHVRYATEAYNIGPAPARESYLRIDKIVEIALRAKADAIHPGYGFLAENPQFARAVAAADLAFIGPPAQAIQAMGNKVEARKLAQQVGAPVVPGVYETLDDAAMIQAAATIGYPVMIKAAAGGGGKGMRRVDEPAEMASALARAHSEAAAAFGDDAVYIEKALSGVRHVEIQILADSKGNVIHLGERECSLQRRHQKLVEEAPSVAVVDKLRITMGAAAVQIAQAANYVNAGTMEFLVDKDSNFYFLEMNTRLQVEHPVTELVTGVDIVKEQIRIASGRPLSLRQENIVMRGWAIECRITAEDPYNHFLPSVGKITKLQEPTGPGVRLETGLYEGMEVSLFYDPLIAKLCVWGETRAAAILRMRRALSEFQIMGVSTAIPFHQKMMESTNFMGGHFDTRFVEEKFEMHQGGAPDKERVAAVIGALLTHERRQTALNIPPTQGASGSAWRARGWKN